ncbi:MAG: TonB-dependent receptor [Cyclobacteriaceae bacterium]
MKKILFILLLYSSLIHAQGTLTGIVTEEGSAQPLPGAQVLISTTLKGDVTDVNGKFRIPAIPAGNYTLTVSFIGYQSQTIPIGITDNEVTNISIALAPGSIELADVIISAGNDRTMNTLSPVDIKLRPTNTSQDILRMVPGLFIAQHAGGGKAEQIFLRGFDIDHGTDINLEVDGLPVNMVSHAHGQGYSDLHFLIPELVQFVDFDKGPYFADKGDFTTAGYVNFQTRNSLDKNFLKTEGGQFGMFRGVTGVNLFPKSSNQSGYIASEFYRSDGYFDSPQDFQRVNISAKYIYNLSASDRLTFGSSFFNSSWDASGQIPERAVKQGDISRFGSLDNTEGGATGRFNAYVLHTHQFENGTFDQQAYGIHYNFNLYSNFTFFLNDPINGDQIQQKESRMIYGYKANYRTEGMFVGKKLSSHAGGGFRYDDVNDIRLSNTVKRKFLESVQRGDINEANANAFVSETLELSDRWSLNAAVRFDYFLFSYYNRLTNDDKSKHASIVSPKLNITYKINPGTQLYVRSGTGFHSNDTRVVVAQDAKQILPRAIGIDAGLDTKLFDNLLVHAALWRLDLEQEFVYVGDAGIVEPSGKTKRQGIDLSVRWQILPWLFADTDLTLADPKSKGQPEGLNNIPLAPKLSSIGGMTIRCKNGLNGSLRYRYLDHRPANEDNSVTAEGYFLVDALLNYTRSKFEIGVSAENIFDVAWKEAQFDTESRMANETTPVSEIHFTPGTPFFAKLHATFFF